MNSADLFGVVINEVDQEIAILQTFPYSSNATDLYSNEIPYGEYIRVWYCANTTAGDFVGTGNVTGIFTAGTTRGDAPNAIQVTATQDGLEESATTSVTIIGGIIHGTVVLQGGERPEAGHDVRLNVKLFDPGEDAWTGTPSANYTYLPGGGGNIANFSANYTTHTLTFDLVGVVPATYDITISSNHTLMRIKWGVLVEPPEQDENFGILLEGNCNDDRQVNATDFSTMVPTYGKSSIDSGFNAEADFDNSGMVNAFDFSLMVPNYGSKYWAPISA